MEMLTQHATELFERIKNQIKEAENIEEQSGEQTKAKVLNLKCDLIKNKEMANEIIEAIQRGGLNCEEREKLVEKIRNLEKKVTDNERQIIRLEWEIHEKDKWIKDLKTDIQEFKLQLAQTRNDLTQTQNDLTQTQNDLTQTRNDLTQTQNDFTQTRNDLTQTQNDLTQTQNDLTQTRNDLTQTRNDLTQTRNDLLKVEGALQTGQLAYNFEKDLARYIYPPGKSFGSQKIFTTMKDWLKKNERTQDGREANKKWNDLQREFSWSPAHERVFFKLVKSRIIVAHPNVDLRVVQSHVGESFSDEENKHIKDLIEINDRVNNLMKE